MRAKLGRKVKCSFDVQTYNMYLFVYKKGKILSDYDSTLMESYNFYYDLFNNRIPHDFCP